MKKLKNYWLAGVRGLRLEIVLSHRDHAGYRVVELERVLYSPVSRTIVQLQVRLCSGEDRFSGPRLFLLPEDFNARHCSLVDLPGLPKGLPVCELPKWLVRRKHAQNTAAIRGTNREDCAPPTRRKRANLHAN